MRSGSISRRGPFVTIAVVLAIAAARCTNSTSLVDPSPVKCQVHLAPQSTSVEAAGGTASVSINTDPECSWNASTAAEWISITSAKSGQGSGKADFRVAANTASTTRHGQVAVNGQQMDVQQAGCAIVLAQTSQEVAALGGSGTVSVSAGTACPWTATSNANWITITAGATGAGNGSVSFEVASNAGDPRSGTLTIGGQTFTVTQGAVSSPSCAAVIAPTSQSMPSQGGSGTVTVTVAAACPWTAISNADWITITSGKTGNGNGTVSFTVTSASSSRTGTLTIAGQTFTVAQSATACTYTLNPVTQTVSAGGNSSFVEVSTTPSCTWNASTSTNWMTITSGASGVGNGRVVFSFDTNTGPPRSGGLTIAGLSATVSQNGGCAPVLSPSSVSVGPSGAAGTSITATVEAACSWTASANVGWLTITGGASGHGGGTITFDVAANTGPSRVGMLTVGGASVTVTQALGCSYSISPSNASPGSAGGSLSTTVTAGDGCTWTASSNAGWITDVSPTSGSGGGAVTFAVQANTGSSRTGTLTIAGQTFTVTQASGCSYSISPSSASPGSAGGSLSTTVTAGAGCTWTASSNAGWITDVSPTSGSGGGAVTFTVQANTGSSRTGTLTIAGQTFTVTQASGCTYSISPSNASPGSAGGPLFTTVTTGGSCTWTASSNASWITGVSPTSGTGSGPVTFTVAANTGSSRTGTLTIAGQTFTVTQASGCTYAIAPSTWTAPHAGGSSPMVAVTTGIGCGWTASSNASWIKNVSPPSGSGPGSVTFTVDANPGTSRMGTLTIAGQTFTVSQP